MSHKRPPIPVIVLLVLVILTAGYFGIRALLNRGGSELSASGTIEAVDTVISPELGGRVSEVLVKEGQAVHTGDVLFRLDDSTFQAQRTVAASSLDLSKAALASAKANYDVVVAAARLESASARNMEWRQENPADFTLPAWYFGRSELIQAAQAEVDSALAAVNNAQTKLDGLLNDPANAAFLSAETRLVNARAAILVAQDVLNRASYATDNTDLKDTAQEAYDAAQAELQDAQAAFDDLEGTQAGLDVRQARSVLAAALARRDISEDRLLALQTGLFSPRVVSAAAAVDQAQAAVAQAEASLALIDVQLGKLEVRAPVDGVVLTLSIQPGEVVSPGTSILTLGSLDELTITVYVPEDRYGELSLGEPALVSVDSFPGEDFNAVITHISDQAEFTPRNVQTVEGRSSTVYAIKLRLEDQSGRLKPGMPADVLFTVK